MHQLFSYEESRRLDALRAAHASDPVHSDFRRHRRPLLRAGRWLRAQRRPDVVIDLRTPLDGLTPPADPELVEVADAVVGAEQPVDRFAI